MKEEVQLRRGELHVSGTGLVSEFLVRREALDEADVGVGSRVGIRDPPGEGPDFDELLPLGRGILVPVLPVLPVDFKCDSLL